MAKSPVQKALRETRDILDGLIEKFDELAEIIKAQRAADREELQRRRARAAGEKKPKP